MSVVCSVRRESQHAEAAESPSEEAVSNCEGENPPAGGTQQGNPCTQQAREFVSGAAETQQDIKGTLYTGGGGADPP